MAVNKGDIPMWQIQNGYARVVSELTVWSNGTKIRRYQGQDKRDTVWHPKEKGFRKMTALLVEEVSD